MDNVNCRGSEKTLLDCGNRRWFDNYYCRYGGGVRCIVDSRLNDWHDTQCLDYLGANT